MDASALDLIVKPLPDDESWTHEFYAQAEAELAALRARVEDLEMIARGFASKLIASAHPMGFGPWLIWDGRLDRPASIVELEIGPDGLPILTAEARRALRGENEGKVST